MPVLDAEMAATSRWWTGGSAGIRVPCTGPTCEGGGSSLLAMTPAEREALTQRAVELYRSGMTITQTAALLGRKYDWVRERLIRAGEPRRRRGPPSLPVEDQLIVDLRAQGLAVVDVAAMVGMSEGNAYWRLRTMAYRHERDAQLVSVMEQREQVSNMCSIKCDGGDLDPAK